MRNFLKTFIFIISLLIISNNGFAEIKIANDDYSDLVKFIASYWDVSVEELIPKTLVLAFDTEEDLLKFVFSVSSDEKEKALLDSGITASSYFYNRFRLYGQSLGKKSKIKNIENYVFVYVDYDALRYDRYATNFDSCFVFHNNKFLYGNCTSDFPRIRNYKKTEDLHSLNMGAEVEKQIEIICDEYEKLLKSQHDNFSKYIFELSEEDMLRLIGASSEEINRVMVTREFLGYPSSKEVWYGHYRPTAVIYKPTNINNCYYVFVFVNHKVYYYEIRGNTLGLDIIAYFNK